MKLLKTSLIATAAMLTVVALSSTAHAGHLNVVLETQLSGHDEVGTPGDPQAKARVQVFGIDGAANANTLCYTIIVDHKLAELDMAPGNGRAAHIHEGAKGANGPVVANLAWPQDGQAGDCISEATEGKFPTKEAGIVQRILKNPQNFYVNVHNSAFPAGAVRGQLVDTATHKH